MKSRETPKAFAVSPIRKASRPLNDEEPPHVGQTATAAWFGGVAERRSSVDEAEEAGRSLNERARFMRTSLVP